jgi:transcriptional regulator with XRE-family HTH domain
MYVWVMAERIGPKRPIRLYLAEWREFRKLDQEQVADRMGVTAATISRHETGERSSNEGYLAALAEALDCHPTDFWRDPAQPSADDLLRDMPEDQRAQVLRIIQTFKTGT